MAELTIVVIVVLIRLLVPFSILKWPFWGMVASLVCDTFDLTVLRFFGWESFGFAGYQVSDKILDLYYLSFGLYVTAQLREVFAQRTLRVLFFWRFAGIALFEITGLRMLLFFAPNLFEYLYLGVFGAKKLFKAHLTPRLVIALLLLAVILKLPQEYVMHYLEFPWGFGNFGDGLKQLF